VTICAMACSGRQRSSLDERLELTQKCLRHCVPLFVLTNRKDPSSAVSNGTGFLMDSAAGQFVITANHVWTAFEAARRQSPMAVLAATRGYGEECVEVRADLADSDEKHLDLAILRPSHPRLLVSSSKEFYRPTLWPPSAVIAGDVVCVVGFPGSLRSPTETDITFKLAAFVVSVTSVSDRHIVLADERNDRHSILVEVSNPDDLDVGGLSGAPVFAFRVSGPEFVGIVYEGHGGVNGTLFASHAKYLGPDGVLDRSLMPWC